jgi:hypothetical protein
MNKTWLFAAALFFSITRLASADCPADADRVGKRLVDLKAPGYMPALKISAPTAKASMSIDKRGFVIAVTKDGKLVVQGDAFKTTKDAELYLDSMWKMGLETHGLEGSGGKAQVPLYVWVDKDTQAKHVAALVAIAAKAGDFQVRLLVAGKDKAPAPTGGAVAIAAKLPAKEPEGTKYLADQLKQQIANCAQAITVLGTSDVGHSMSKKYNLADTMPKALKDCGCKVSKMDVFEWAIAEWYGAQGAGMSWVPIPKIEATEAQPISKFVK